MSEIDWTKAPVDAIGALVTKPNNIHHPKTTFASSIQRDGCVFRGKSCDGFALAAADNCWDWIGRPWSGEGVPPIGFVVEIRNTGWGIRETAEAFIGVPVHVRAHFNTSTGCEMIAVDGGPDLGCEVFRADMAVPVRTPEQIAAEEREKEIAESAKLLGELAIDDDCPPGRKTAWLWMAEKLYAAGYRKQEQPK